MILVLICMMNYREQFSIYTRMQSLASLIFNISDTSDLHVVPELKYKMKFDWFIFFSTQIKNRKNAIKSIPFCCVKWRWECF